MVKRNILLSGRELDIKKKESEQSSLLTFFVEMSREEKNPSKLAIIFQHFLLSFHPHFWIELLEIFPFEESLPPPFNG